MTADQSLHEVAIALMNAGFTSKDISTRKQFILSLRTIDAALAAEIRKHWYWQMDYARSIIRNNLKSLDKIKL